MLRSEECCSCNFISMTEKKMIGLQELPRETIPNVPIRIECQSFILFRFVVNLVDFSFQQLQQTTIKTIIGKESILRGIKEMCCWMQFNAFFFKWYLKQRPQNQWNHTRVSFINYNPFYLVDLCRTAVRRNRWNVMKSDKWVFFYKNMLDWHVLLV